VASEISLKRLSEEAVSFEDFELREILDDHALTGGKRLRLFVGLQLSELLGSPKEISLAYLEVAEMLHAATLVHDDVIDESDIRRGLPSVRAVRSNRHAILAGDYLLAKVISRIASLENLAATKSLAETLEEIVEGEWLQAEACGSLDITAESLERIAEKKTGALFEWCCETAVFAGAPTSFSPSLKLFGRVLGLCFQMVDDILDFQTKTGKPALQDLQSRLINFVTQEILEHHPELRQKWSWNPAQPAWSASQLLRALERVRSRVEAQSASLEFILNELAPNDSPQKKNLMDVIEQIKKRTK